MSTPITRVSRRGYGWKKDKPDEKDLKLSFDRFTHQEENLTEIDLRSKCLKVYDQGQLGSCTANAI